MKLRLNLNKVSGMECEARSSFTDVAHLIFDLIKFYIFSVLVRNK